MRTRDEESEWFGSRKAGMLSFSSNYLSIEQLANTAGVNVYLEGSVDNLETASS